jgi:hypothetical protein
VIEVEYTLRITEDIDGSDFHLRRCDSLENVVSRMQYWLDGRTLSASEKRSYFLTE